MRVSQRAGGRLSRPGGQARSSGDERRRRGQLGETWFPPTKNAPSRWRLRPASRLTAAEATADRRAINLGRSVLGASGTLGGRPGAVKATRSELSAFCEDFFSHRVELHFDVCALDQNESCGAAEPGRRTRERGQRIRRAGNAFVHLPDRLSASAYSCSEGFVLPAPRARRSDESMQQDLSLQGVATLNFAQIARLRFSPSRARTDRGNRERRGRWRPRFMGLRATESCVGQLRSCRRK